MKLILIAIMTIVLVFSKQSQTPKEISWENLIPIGYSMDEISNRYEKRLEKLDYLSEEAEKIFVKMDNELNNGPVNTKLNNTYIKLAGFITPLKQEKDKIYEFLFVPFLGACMHVPAPPINQTIYVKTNKKNGVKLEDIYKAFYAIGKLQTAKKETSLANTGYSILNAKISYYQEPSD